MGEASLGDRGNPLAVMALDSMLRRANRAQAGSQRLHGQAYYSGGVRVCAV
jgi:hypothetical protein